MNYSPNGGNRELHTKRSRPILINMLQTEYIYGYSNQFCPIPKFNTDDIPSALAWNLFEIMSSCKDLWKIVDMKQNSFRWSGWEGWILTSIKSQCFQFQYVPSDRRSPFKKLTTLSAISKKGNGFIPAEFNYYTNEDGELFYEFDIS